ncbi:MAG: ankyrin repeat domain-containing protein, partial [Planctomycetota bacterium]
QGRLNIIDFDFFRNIAERGTPERNLWQFSWAGRRRFDPVWDMVLEFSTGYSGSFARQFTLSRSSVDNELLTSLINALELSAKEGAIVLEIDGALLGSNEANGLQLQFDARQKKYVSSTDVSSEMYSRGELIEMARRGEFIGTLTARHGEKDDVTHPQPGIWTQGPIEQQRGRQEFPVLYEGNLTMVVSGRHLQHQPNIIVDGRKVDGEVRIGRDEKVEVELSSLPSDGMHLLQLQNQNGMFTNDFIFHVTRDAESAEELRRQIERENVEPAVALAQAVIRGDLNEIRFQLAHGASIDQRRRDGSTLLSTAALHGRTEVVSFLLKEGAKVDATNRDGNTPLHVAAFLCHTDIVKLLLNHGASVDSANGRTETPIDVVSSEWNRGTADFYRGIGRAIGITIDLEQVRDSRPRIAAMLREQSETSVNR